MIAYEDAHAETEQAHFGHEFFERAMGLGGWAPGTVYREAGPEPGLGARDLPRTGHGWSRPIDRRDLRSGLEVGLDFGWSPGGASPATTAPAIAGWPIATVPMGTAEGLPVGLGIIGRPGSEALMLALGAAVDSRRCQHR